MDTAHSYVIGDRATDIQLADNMGITGVRDHRETWTGLPLANS